MSTHKTRKIESALARKGFHLKSGRSKHLKYTLYYDGKKTGVFTFISHGLSEYNDNLLNVMRKQLYLESPQELDDLIECPMSEEELKSLLVARGVLKTKENDLSK